MELKLKPSDKNLYPVGALLIRGSSIKTWLSELEAMHLSLASVTVYPLPGLTVHSVWGCLVVGTFAKGRFDPGRNVFCQTLFHQLYIPVGAALFPALSAEETTKLFKGIPHLLHPEVGLVELQEPITWENIIQRPGQIALPVQRPAATPFIPSEVKTFQVKAPSAEEALKAIDGTLMPSGQKFTEAPLNPFGIAKLFVYRQLFFKESKEGHSNDESSTERGMLLAKLEGLRKWLSGKESNWSKNLQQDFEALEKRNQKHLDRLVAMLKKNPAEALKYALPLDNGGASRGGVDGRFQLEKRWFHFSLFDNSGGFGGGGGTALLSGDAYGQLHRQYTEAAQALMKQKDYRKAAFVYLKLLKDPMRAAQTLEAGNLYTEAAAVYLKHTTHKEKAAECFEKGAVYSNAIELYLELSNHEKAGDLYLLLHKKREALACYQKVVDGYVEHHQYLKAAQLQKNKMELQTEARDTLLKGWRLNRDAFNCLNNYFANFMEAKPLGLQMQLIYQREVTETNRAVFLKVLQHEYGKHPELKQPIRDMAYEIVAAEVKQNPAVVSELKWFNKEDKQLVKDTFRFELNR